MPAPHDTPDGLEAMAFQLLLHKIARIEQAIQGIPPLLAKIVDHLEAQTQQPAAPTATYAQLYPGVHEASQGGGNPSAGAPPTHAAALVAVARAGGCVVRYWALFVAIGAWAQMHPSLVLALSVAVVLGLGAARIPWLGRRMRS